MEGLVYISHVPERVSREQFQILRDEPIYREVKRFASIAEMSEIDGWARSFYTLEGHLESIEHYRKPLLPEPTTIEWIRAKEIVWNEVRSSLPTIKSLSFEDGFDSVSYESSSAAGYGYAGKKGEGDNFKRAKGIANALIRTFAERIPIIGRAEAEQEVILNSTPDVGFTRTQLAKLPSIKVRNVFGEAFHYILIEGLSAFPLLAAFREVESFYVTGKDPISYVPSYLVRLNQIPGWSIALDWSRFDATVQLWEIDHAFNCLEQILQFPDYLSKLAFDVSRLLFKHRKLAAPDGTLWMRNGGIPSGSYFTNIVGSIINYTRVQYICQKMSYPIRSCRVQGDDSVMKVDIPERPDMYAIADIVAEFGWMLNPTKCVTADRTEDITFLGRSHRQQLNVRERLKVLRLMCFPEYEVDDPKISTARARMIARDAGFNDPLYNNIVYAMLALYGEADEVPRRHIPYVSKRDWEDVNM